MCIRNFTVAAGFLLCQVSSVYSAYTRRMKGYTEGGVDGMCTDFVYLMDNGSGF